MRIERVLAHLRSRRDQTQYASQLAWLDQFVSSARILDYKLDGPRLREAVATVIRCCAGVSYGGGHRSLETLLRGVPGGRSIAETKEVMQIDKLARYLGLCRDLAKLSRRRPFRKSTKMVTLEPLTAFESERPVGALKSCHVHAEVQLILHYEQHPPERPPRAIGCSKSACFLCDMLIQKLGKYQISFSHRRLYNQWTIKDVKWMTTERRLCFQHILTTMIDDMLLLAKALRARDTKRLRLKTFGLESRAVLPLSSASSLAHVPEEPRTAPQLRTLASRTTSPAAAKRAPMSLGALTGLGSEAGAGLKVPAVLPAAALSYPIQPFVLDLNKSNLPYRQLLESETVTHVDLGQLFLIFECSSSSAGSLSIREVKEDEVSKGEKELRRVRVCDLTTSEVSVGCASTIPSDITFWLQMDHDKAIEIEVVWQDQPQSNSR